MSLEVPDYTTTTDGSMTITSNVPDPVGHVEPEPEPTVVADPDPDADVEPAIVGEPVADAARDDQGRFAKPKNPRDDPRKRVEAATAKEAAAKREREEAIRERDELRARVAAYEAKQAPTPVGKATSAPSDAEPDPADAAKYPDGQYDRQYLKDQARWEARQEVREERGRWERESAARREGQSWQDKLAKTRTAIPDFDARVARADVEIDTRVMPYIRAQDDGPQIALYLAEHPDEAQALLSLHPVAQIGQIGRIQARLEAASSRGPAPTPSVSRAPAPVQPLGGGARTVESDDDDLPFNQWMAKEDARDRARRR